MWSRPTMWTQRKFYRSAGNCVSSSLTSAAVWLPLTSSDATTSSVNLESTPSSPYLSTWWSSRIWPSTWLLSGTLAAKRWLLPRRPKTNGFNGHPVDWFDVSAAPVARWGQDHILLSLNVSFVRHINWKQLLVYLFQGKDNCPHKLFVPLCLWMEFCSILKSGNRNVQSTVHMLNSYHFKLAAAPRTCFSCQLLQCHAVTSHCWLPVSSKCDLIFNFFCCCCSELILRFWPMSGSPFHSNGLILLNCYWHRHIKSLCLSLCS